MLACFPIQFKETSHIFPNNHNKALKLRWYGVTQNRFTFPTDADFEDSFSQTISSRHTEASITGILIWGGQYIWRRGKAEGRDALHLCVSHVTQMNGSACNEEPKQTRTSNKNSL